MKRRRTPIYKVTTTFETKEQAQEVVDVLINQKLVACASIHPIHSTYRWDKKVIKTEEFEVNFKVAPSNFALFKSRLLGLHPYQVPQFLVFESTETTDSYQLWIDHESERK